MAKDFSELQKLLDQQEEWPLQYLFKFIVPIQHKNDLVKLLASPDIQFRESKNAAYVSVTVRKSMPNSEAIIAVYESANSIEGLIIL